MRITRTRAIFASLAVHGCVVALAAHWLPQSGGPPSLSCELCVALQIPEPAGGLLAEEPAAEPEESAESSQPPEPVAELEIRPTEITAPPSLAQNEPLPPPSPRTLAMSVPAAVAQPTKASRTRSALAASAGSSGNQSGGPHGGEAGDRAATPPRLLRKVRPLYPEIARRSGWEGAVELTLSVDTQGRVARVRVQRSSGHEALDAAAVAAARSYEFSPALAEGRPIAWTFEHRIVFTRK